MISKKRSTKPAGTILPPGHKAGPDQVFGRFVGIVAALRGPNGCPWDKEQTHESLKPYLLEEAHETLEAIDIREPDKLCEELGDILLHVVMHAQLAQEAGQFSINDVVGSITRKMIRRHPHVFGKTKVGSVDEVWRNWEKTKKKEKKGQGGIALLKSLPASLPALYRAEKVQRRAARLGFDWDNVAGALDKVHEEIKEVAELFPAGQYSKLKEEIGDLLFAVVNVARKLNIDAEESLREAVGKFLRRFEYMENRAARQGRDLSQMTIEAMEKLWQEGKKKLQSPNLP